MVRKIALVILLYFTSLVCVALAEESITFTTYYPSPYGSYNELSANRFTLSGTKPNRDGDLVLKAQVGFPSGWSTVDVQEGQIAYSSSTRSLYVYDATGWSPVGAKAQYVGRTSLTYDGAGVGGYSGGDTKCNAVISGSRMCSAADFTYTKPFVTATGWYSSYVTSYDNSIGILAISDCNGWTSSNGAIQGPRWLNTMPYTLACSNTDYILCCR